MAVHVSTLGPVTLVELDRPHVRNAVDAELLTEAFGVTPTCGPGERVGAWQASLVSEVVPGAARFAAGDGRHGTAGHDGPR